MKKFESFISQSEHHAYMAVIYGVMCKNSEVIVIEEKLFSYLKQRCKFERGNLNLAKIWSNIKFYYDNLNDREKFLQVAITHIPQDQLNHLMQTLIFIYPRRFYNDGLIDSLNGKLDNAVFNLSFLKELVSHSIVKPCVVKYTDDSY